jgi:two-component sensor histidine kinase
MAAIPAFLIILFLPSVGSRYKLDIEPVNKNFAQYSYVDLNSDDISETVRSGKGIPYFHIIVQDNNFRVFDQWNFKDSLDADLADFFFGNYDNDSYKEIYAFTYKDDSLFLNINEFFETDGIRLDRIFITKISLVNKKITSNVWPAGFFDLTGDGKGELYFCIQTGFGLEPRLFYSFDIVKKELKVSQFTGVICQLPEMVDSDGDGKPEIFGLMSASGNYNSPVPFTDKSTWFMVFNEMLGFEFPPVEFPGLTNELRIKNYKNGKLSEYVLTHNTGSADSSVLKPRIMVFSLDGKKIRERLFTDFGLTRYTNMVVLNHRNTDRIYILGNSFLEINDKLETINKAASFFNTDFNIYLQDVNLDGENELLLYSYSIEELLVYNASLEKLADVKIRLTGYPVKFSKLLSKDQENKLFLSTKEEGYFLKLKKNNYFFLGYSVYPGIYFLIFFFILLIRKITTWQIEQRESLKQRLVTLQLQGIKSQLDPHFTFNTLNSIASLIYLEDRQAAYDYLNKFTQLLRGMLNDAERIYRSLSEEVEFVTTYLDLEKLRFGEKFNYVIETGVGITMKEQVPKLVLQTFAENSIKHGILPRDEGGLIKIRIDRENDYIKLTIEDNGIGRANSAGHSTSTGKGLKLTGEFYDILNQINKRPIIHKITDLYDESGVSAGTRVEVWVPVEDQGKR